MRSEAKDGNGADAGRTRAAEGKACRQFFAPEIGRIHFRFRKKWRHNHFCTPSQPSNGREQTSEVRALKAENQRLARELKRKEKALAEAAALLVLQKKYRALLGGEVE